MPYSVFYYYAKTQIHNEKFHGKFIVNIVSFSYNEDILLLRGNMLHRKAEIFCMVR